MVSPAIATVGASTRALTVWGGWVAAGTGVGRGPTDMVVAPFGASAELQRAPTLIGGSRRARIDAGSPGRRTTNAPMEARGSHHLLSGHRTWISPATAQSRQGPSRGGGVLTVSWPSGSRKPRPARPWIKH